MTAPKPSRTSPRATTSTKPAAAGWQPELSRARVLPGGADVRAEPDPVERRRSRQRVHQPLVGPRQRREQRDDEGRAREREHDPADRRGTSASLGRPCQPRAERAERGRQEPRHGGSVCRVQVQPLRHRVPRPAEGQRPAEDHRARDEPRRRGDEHPRAEPAPPFQIRDVEVRSRRADEHERAEQDEREHKGKSHADISRVQLDAVGKQDLAEPVHARGGDGCGQRGGKPGARPHRPSARQESDRDPQERVSRAAHGEDPAERQRHPIDRPEIRQGERAEAQRQQAPRDEDPLRTPGIAVARKVPDDEREADGVHGRGAQQHPRLEIRPAERQPRREVAVAQVDERVVKPGHEQRRGHQRQQHEPVEEQVADHGRAERPRVGREEPLARAHVADVAPQTQQRLRLDVVGRPVPGLELLELARRRRIGARAMEPGRQPRAGEAAARDGRQIVEAAQHSQARERLQHADAEARAADPAAGEAQRRVAGAEHGGVERGDGR